MSSEDMGIDRALLRELPFFPESAVWRPGLADRDYIRNYGAPASAGRIKPKRRAEYVGTADHPCPRERDEHVVPGVNVDKPRGAFTILVDAVAEGRVPLSSLDEKTARRVARILFP